MKQIFFTIFSLLLFAMGGAQGALYADETTSATNERNDIITEQRDKIAKQTMNLSAFHFAGVDENIFDFFPIIIRFATVLIGVVSVLSLIIGGFMYIVSFGDEGQADKAKKVILGSLIGLAIVLASYVIQSGFLQILYSLGK
mgnify:CR=1 FL=1|jgi:hypothetical protein